MDSREHSDLWLKESLSQRVDYMFHLKQTSLTPSPIPISSIGTRTFKNSYQVHSQHMNFPGKLQNSSFRTIWFFFPLQKVIQILSFSAMGHLDLTLAILHEFGAGVHLTIKMSMIINRYKVNELIVQL